MRCPKGADQKAGAFSYFKNRRLKNEVLLKKSAKGMMVPVRQSTPPIRWKQIGGKRLLRERLSKNLYKIRTRNRWTQEHAAELCGLSSRYWGKLERGQTSASLETIERIMTGLQVDIIALFEESDPREEER